MTNWIITSTVLILIVMLLRTLLKGHISLRLQYALWGLVLLRLLIPGSLFESNISVMNAVPPSVTAVVQTENGPQAPVQNSPIQNTTIQNTPIQPQTAPAAQLNSSNAAPAAQPDTAPRVSSSIPSDTAPSHKVTISDVLTALWIAGICAVSGALIAANVLFAQRLRWARKPFDTDLTQIPVYVVNGIPSPCLFGLFRPAIYLTPEVTENEAQLQHIVTHELTHLRHGDNWWSLLRSVALALHWYNPLVWVAAVFSRRDGEMACDEGAVRALGEDQRLDYGRTLIALVSQKQTPGGLLCCATTMNSGKRSLTERIRLLAKKPRMLAVTLVAVILLSIVAVGCTFTGRNTEGEDPEGTEPSQTQPFETDAAETLPPETEPSVQSPSLEERRETANEYYRSLDFSNISITDAQGTDISEELIWLWINCNRVYNVDDRVIFERGGEYLRENGPYYEEILDYGEVVDSIFSANGRAQLESAIIGGADFIWKEDGKVYRMAPWKTGVSYADALVDMTVLSASDNEILLSAVYRESVGSLENPEYIQKTATFRVVKENGHWLVDDYFYPENQHRQIQISLNVTLPAEIQDLVIMEEAGGWSETYGTCLYKLWEKKSVEQYTADYGEHDGYAGSMFGIYALSQAEFEQNMCYGQETYYFAKDEKNSLYYAFVPTGGGVSQYRSGGGTTAEDTNEWIYLWGMQEELAENIIQANGLTPYTNEEFEALRTQDFYFEGEHAYAVYYPYYSDGNLSDYYFITLTQPAKQGEGGIWCVDRIDHAYDYNVVRWRYFPTVFISAQEWYAQLQDNCDAGFQTELLDPLYVAEAALRARFSVEPVEGSLVLADAEGNALNG